MLMKKKHNPRQLEFKVVDNCLALPSVFDLEKKELLDILPRASYRWLVGAIIALFDFFTQYRDL